MLKPKKNNITKKEIQKDPLLETIDQFQVKVEKNKQLYGKLLVGALVLIVIVSFLVRNNRSNNYEADTALGKALISIEKRDFTTAVFQLENVINDYESTSSSDLALFYLGKIHYKENEMEKARKHISKYLESSSKNILRDAASKILADISFRENDLSSAINFIDSALNNCTSLFNCRSLELKKAFYLIEKGDLSTANKLLLNLKNQKNIEVGQKKIAEELIGKLSSY
tara:strand:+ start:67 stop:747 length:681 start_codon:yes stop_codon:yes gene_type:complete